MSKIYSPTELNEILEKHILYLNNEVGGERAPFWGANLRDANLRGANLSGVDLSGVGLPSFSIVPNEGQFIAYKKVCGAVLTLLIPRSALRVSTLVGRKCRASKAKVISAEDFDGNAITDGREFRANHNNNFKYKVGSWVKPDKYDGDIRFECTHGIHFFITKQEAIDY